MVTRLVLVHGRNQHGKDPDELRDFWLDALATGFDGVGRDLPDDVDVVFPFFGDALFDLTNEDSLDEADDVIGDDAESAIGREAIGELLDEAGVPAGDIDAQLEATDAGGTIHPGETATVAPDERRGGGGGALSWEWVQAGLSVLDRYIPGASAASLAYATNDVSRYLSDPEISSEIDEVVADAFARCAPGDRVVVVAHSLGSVIVYKLLAQGALPDGVRVDALVSVGSPLGVRAIREAVSPIAHPAGLGWWFNAYDPRDVVALFPLDQRHFAIRPPIVNHGHVDNTTYNHHRIEGYLTDPTVAVTIHDALSAGVMPPVLRRRRPSGRDPRTIDELPTPCLVVEESVFEANCAAMDSKRPGLLLRPHVKAFKSTALARRLAADNHTAFCAATVAEIEGLVGADLGADLLLANETLDAARLGRLSDRAQITVAVDSDATLDAAVVGGVRSVLIDVSVGLPRCGCDPLDAGRLAGRARRAGLEVRGVMGYEGHLMMVEDRQERIDKVEASMAILLRAAGEVGGEIISGGGTGTYDTNRWVTEIQAGSYTLMDTQYETLDLPFRCALDVMATVISVDPKGWIVADAGLKALGMDHGNPRWPHGDVWFCSDEHVTMRPHEPGRWRVGDLVRLQPAHVDPTVARHPAMWVVDGDRIVDRWPVDLRGW